MKRYIKSAIKPFSEEDLDTKRSIVRNTGRTEELAKLSDTDDYFIQLELAQNPNTPVDILDKFTNFRYSSHVRAAVASNPNTTRDVLYKLMRIGDPIVYRAIAENPITPLDLLDEIAHKRSIGYSDFSQAQAAVARRSDVTRGILAYLSTVDNSDVKSWVARNPNTPDDVLQRLSNDEDWWVKDSVTKNPRFPDLKL